MKISEAVGRKLISLHIDRPKREESKFLGGLFLIGVGVVAGYFIATLIIR